MGSQQMWQIPLLFLPVHHPSWSISCCQKTFRTTRITLDGPVRWQGKESQIDDVCDIHKGTGVAHGVHFCSSFPVFHRSSGSKRQAGWKRMFLNPKGYVVVRMLASSRPAFKREAGTWIFLNVKSRCGSFRYSWIQRFQKKSPGFLCHHLLALLLAKRILLCSRLPL